MTSSQPPAAERLLMIDGLRGIASLWVVLFHLWANLEKYAPDFVISPVRWLLDNGYVGVNIFFVISGFVIAMSTGDRHCNGRYIGFFALRRSIRLDPPYWLSILVVVALAYLSAQFIPGMADRQPPATGQIIANVFYLQNLTGYGDINAVYWTLCLEVQFYLFFVLAIGLLQKLSASTSISALGQRGWLTLFIAVSGAASLADYFNLITEQEIWGWFVTYWFQFLLGVSAYWLWRGMIPARSYWPMVLAVAVLAFYHDRMGAMVALATLLLINLALYRGKMGQWLGNRPIQYLGKLSYSLYLFHPIFGWSVISLLKRYLDPANSFNWLLMFAVGLAVSVVVAAVVHRLVEQPCLRLCKRIVLPGPVLNPQRA